MSKKHKRKFIKETYCLNCKTVLTDQFCAHCGQKAFLDKDSFWHMVLHFTSDYFHYDGKFLVTIKDLFLHPGQTTRNYISGQRKKYLNPIQMYLFVSAIFLIVSTHEYEKNVFPKHQKINFEEITRNYNAAQHFRDSVFQHAEYKESSKTNTTKYGFIIKRKVSTIAQYDSCEASIPEYRRDNFFERIFHRKLLQLNEETLDASTLGFDKYFKVLIHNLPKAFFLLLPLFAFVLSLLFNKFPFTDHLIFSLHYHTVAFILITLSIFITSFLSSFIGVIVGISILVINLVYLCIAMKKAFQESLAISVGRCILFSGIYGLIFLFVIMALSVLSYFLI